MDKWKKLKTTVKEEVRLCKKFLGEAIGKGDFAECLEYKAELTIVEWVILAMDELDGTRHHGIFTFKPVKLKRKRHKK